MIRRHLDETYVSKDKRRPTEERIAALMGRSCYVDLREGLGGTTGAKLTDQDIAAGLGMVASVHGKTAMQVLETYYASTLMHERALQAAWEERERKKGDTREAIVLMRFAGALGIRQFAGVVIPSTQFGEYAYLIFSRRDTLQKRVGTVLSWLEGERDTAVRELRQILHGQGREPV